MEATSFDNPVVPEDFTVIVVDEDAGLGEFLAGELERVVGTFTDVNDLPAPGGPLTVVVLGPSCASAASLTVVEERLRNRRDLAALLLIEFMTPDILHRALKAGVRDVLAAPFDRDQLLAAVNRAGDALTNYQHGLESPAIAGLDEGRRRQVGARRQHRRVARPQR